MKTLFWLLGGAAVGAGAALLYAPMEGTRTRSLLRDKMNKYGHDISDTASSKARHWKNVATGWRHESGKMVEEAGDFMHDMAGKSQEMGSTSAV